MAKVTGKNNLAFYAGIFGVGALLVSGAIVFGTSDKGQIDVSASIANSNTAAKERGEQEVAQPSNSAFSSMPNGGLVGKEESSSSPPPPPPTEVRGATTTSEETEDENEDSTESDEVTDTADETEEVDDAEDASGAVEIDAEAEASQG